MKQDIIEKLVRPMIRKVTPYRSARDEFENFDAQNRKRKLPYNANIPLKW